MIYIRWIPSHTPIPYLIPSAAQLLDTIGSNFLDSLTAKGLNPNKVIVTSVLRTQDDVKTPAPPQRKCLRKFCTLLWYNIRCKLETFPENRR